MLFNWRTIQYHREWKRDFRLSLSFCAKCVYGTQRRRATASILSPGTNLPILAAPVWSWLARGGRQAELRDSVRQRHTRHTYSTFSTNDSLLAGVASRTFRHEPSLLPRSPIRLIELPETRAPFTNRLSPKWSGKFNRPSVRDTVLSFIFQHDPLSFPIGILAAASRFQSQRVAIKIHIVKRGVLYETTMLRSCIQSYCPVKLFLCGVACYKKSYPM